jgi:hypothetical protein
MKLVWDNGKPTRAVSDLRCEQGRWTPRTPDATEQTYKHLLSIGAYKMQEHCKEHYMDTWRENVAEETVSRLLQEFDL